MTDDEMKDHLLDQIAEMNEHFVDLMNSRLPEVSPRELEMYVQIVGKLIAKLEQTEKPLRTAAQELFAEVATVVMSELRR